MSLGKLAFKRKYTSEVDVVEEELQTADEELQAALLVVERLKQKRQKVIQAELPIVRAFRLANVKPTPSRERIFESLYLLENGHILPLTITAIVAEYDGTTNVHDLMVAALFSKKLFAAAIDGVWSKGLFYPKKAVVDETLPRELSFHIASFIGCSELDGVMRTDGKKMSACPCVPEFFCPRARLGFCKFHTRLDKDLVTKEIMYRVGDNERIIPANLHAKHMCNGCWLVCPCKSMAYSDIPLNGLMLQNRPWKCVQCLVTICLYCHDGNSCDTCSVSNQIASTPNQGLCVNCKNPSDDCCAKCPDDDDEE